MGRPRKTTSNKNNFKVINLNKAVENTPIINSNTAQRWVYWGKKNDYPTLLLNLYHNSVIHRACVDFISQTIMGDGVDYDTMEMNNSETYPNFNETWDTFLSKLALDMVLYGGFAFQIIKNRDNKTYSYYHQQFGTIRLGRMDEDGDIKYAYLCSDWSNTVKNAPKEIELFNFTDDEHIAMGKSYLFYYSEYNPFDNYYPQPSYSSALNAIQADAKLQAYDLNSIVNNFTPSGILTLNPVADDNERELILKNINATFSGEENANNLIITFRNSIDDKATEFTPIQSNNEGVNLFSDTNERVTNRIISAHRIPNKALIGMPMDSTGFSNEGSLLQTSYNLLEKVKIAPLRNKIFTFINKMFAMNGIDTKVIVKPLSFNLEVNTTSTVDNQDNVNTINDNNVNYEDKINTI